jgi:5S rRNA maturation endonuclease (ribonuclease M5)
MKNNAERIKDSIEFDQLLEYLGIEYFEGTSSQGERYVLAKVPWRVDRNPSLIARKKGNRWLFTDMAKGEGGTVIDFVMRFKGISFKEALRWLEENEKNIENIETVKKNRDSRTSFLTSKEKRFKVVEATNEEKERILEKVIEIWKLREIPNWLSIGKKIYEIIKTEETKYGKIRWKREKEDLIPVLLFQFENKKYWRSIFPDENQKGWLSNNEPFIIRQGSKKLFIVEGFTDALAIYQISEGDILVLGTAYNYNKVNIEEIKRYYKEIHIATDNDEMGRKAYNELKKLLPTSKRFEYEGKDPMEAYLQGFFFDWDIKIRKKV